MTVEKEVEEAAVRVMAALAGQAMPAPTVVRDRQKGLFVVSHQATPQQLGPFSAIVSVISDDEIRSQGHDPTTTRLHDVGLTAVAKLKEDADKAEGPIFVVLNEQ